MIRSGKFIMNVVTSLYEVVKSFNKGLKSAYSFKYTMRTDMQLSNVTQNHSNVSSTQLCSARNRVNRVLKINV